MRKPDAKSRRQHQAAFASLHSRGKIHTRIEHRRNSKIKDQIRLSRFRSISAARPNIRIAVARDPSSTLQEPRLPNSAPQVLSGAIGGYFLFDDRPSFGDSNFSPGAIPSSHTGLARSRPASFATSLTSFHCYTNARQLAQVLGPHFRKTNRTCTADAALSKSSAADERWSAGICAIVLCHRRVKNSRSSRESAVWVSRLCSAPLRCGS